MEAFINSLFLVFAGEMGDKTQLLALLLATKYRKPWTILSAVTLATLLNHALATWVGEFAASFIEPEFLKWILALTFFGFAIWVLIPDKEESAQSNSRFGAFMTTLITFFLVEMGDKTQLATIALGAHYSQLVLVTLGTTMGMVLANSLAIFCGDRILKIIPMKWMRRTTSFLFIVFGIATVIGF